MSITPKEIFNVLDLARNVRKNGDIMNPLFVSPPGFGKSMITQTWANKNGLPFIDLRAAYLEAPDLIGFPEIFKKDSGRTVTMHHTPEFWPEGGEGVLLLDEPNRGSQSVLNTFMQILTDRKVHNYELPDGWIIVGCINPEDENYEVNTMDPALKDRFEMFQVQYSKKDFIDYMEGSEWNQDIINFVKAGLWKYSKPEDIKSRGGKYVSPRTWSKVNSVLRCSLTQNLELNVYQAILGEDTGAAFYSFKNDERPVMFQDLKGSKAKSLRQLEYYSDPENYKTGMISITISDMVKNYSNVTNALLKDVIMAIPADRGANLLREFSYKNRKDEPEFVDKFMSEYPKVQHKLKEKLG